MIRVPVLAVVVVLCVAAALSAQFRERNRGFGLNDADWCRQARDARICEVRDATISDPGLLAIDSRPNGGVSVRGSERSDVRVRVRVTGYGRNDTAVRELVSESLLRTDNGRIRIARADHDTDRNRRERRNNNGEWVNAAFEVEVPRDARLSIDVTNGGIVVDGVRGAVDARTTNGGLVFMDLAGDVRGRAVNGGVIVDLSGNRWDGVGMDVRTTNGGVRLRLPSDYSADLEAQAQNGGITIDVPLMLQSPADARRHVRGTIGSGGAPIRLTTHNGGVSVHRR